MKEIWCPVPSLPGYQVSNTGKVRRFGKIVPVHSDKHGGLMFNVKLRGKYTTRRLARVVGEAFCPGYLPGLRPKFLDGDSWNCAAYNIVWDVPNANRLKDVKQRERD